MHEHGRGRFMVQNEVLLKFLFYDSNWRLFCIHYFVNLSAWPISLIFGFTSVSELFLKHKKKKRNSGWRRRKNFEISFTRKNPERKRIMNHNWDAAAQIP